MKSLKNYTDSQLLEELRSRNICLSVWYPMDVMEYALENLDRLITEEQAAQILKNIERHHDANLGITWDTLDAEITEFLENLDSHEND